MNRIEMPGNMQAAWNQKRNLLLRLAEMDTKNPSLSVVCGTDLGDLRRYWAEVLASMLAAVPWFGCDEGKPISHPLVQWSGHGKGRSAWKSYHKTRWADQYTDTFAVRCLDVVGEDWCDKDLPNGSFALHAWDAVHPAFLRKIIGRTNRGFKDSRWIINAYAYGFPHGKLMVDHPGLIYPADDMLVYTDPTLLQKVVPESTKMLTGIRGVLI